LEDTGFDSIDQIMAVAQWPPLKTNASYYQTYG
jgi:hypothetical protein